MDILKYLGTILLFICLSGTTWAAIEDYEFETQEQRERFNELSEELRCPLCLNANLAGSDAPIAADLRREIYNQIMEGRSDEEIINFLQARYGDFILYRPPVRPGTYLLWFGPPVLLILGFFIVRRTMKKSQEETVEAELSPEERKKLQRILSSNTDS